MCCSGFIRGSGRYCSNADRERGGGGEKGQRGEGMRRTEIERRRGRESKREEDRGRGKLNFRGILIKKENSMEIEFFPLVRS